MYCCGVSESEHNRFTQFNLSALSKREKSFMFQPPAVFCSIRVVFLILAGLGFQIKSNVILFTSLKGCS